VSQAIDSEAGQGCPARRWPVKPAPMPEKPSPLQRLSGAMKSSLAPMRDVTFAFSGVGRNSVPNLVTGRRTWLFLVREPALIRQILVGRAAAFPKGAHMRAMLHHLVGDSIFVANGETWRWRRAIVDQALEQARVRDVMSLMCDAAEALADRIDERIGETAVVRIDDATTHFAADVIFRTLFSAPIDGDDAARLFAAFERYQSVVYRQSVIAAVGIPGGWLPGARRARRAALDIREMVARPLRRRLEDRKAGRPTRQDDILASLIVSADPVTGARLGERELVDEAATLLLAGHETSASALAWALYLLAFAPEAQARCHAEAVQVLGDRRPAFADMKALAFTRNEMREALRLYPPIPLIPREATGPEPLDDYVAQSGAVVVTPPWILHRQARFWADPDAFHPDRFDTPAGKAAAREAYFPFSMGPRVCPGAAFAMQEATLALAVLSRRFRFSLVPGQDPEPVGRLTVRSANGVRLEVSRRTAGAA
jgi:cytochrome P450